MNKKAYWQIIIAVILASIMCISVLSACSVDSGKNVSKIQIVSGSFKEIYSLDEQIDYDKVYIIATYSNGETQQIKAEPNWVSGLDVSTTGVQKTLTVTYKGASASFLYSVNYKNSVTTPIRLAAAKQDGNGQKEITLALNGLDKMKVYAVKIDITLNGMTFISKEDAFAASWDVATSAQKGKLSLLFYSKDGNTPLEGQGGLAKLYLSGQADSIYLEVTVSDGISDHRTPDVSLNIK